MSAIDLRILRGLGCDTPEIMDRHAYMDGSLLAARLPISFVKAAQKSFDQAVEVKRRVPHIYFDGASHGENLSPDKKVTSSATRRSLIDCV